METIQIPHTLNRLCIMCKNHIMPQYNQKDKKAFNCCRFTYLYITYRRIHSFQIILLPATIKFLFLPNASIQPNNSQTLKNKKPPDPNIYPSAIMWKHQNIRSAERYEAWHKSFRLTFFNCPKALTKRPIKALKPKIPVIESTLNQELPVSTWPLFWSKVAPSLDCIDTDAKPIPMQGLDLNSDKRVSQCSSRELAIPPAAMEPSFFLITFSK